MHQTKLCVFDERSQACVFDERSKACVFDERSKARVFDERSKACVFDTNMVQFDPVVCENDARVFSNFLWSEMFTDDGYMTAVKE